MFLFLIINDQIKECEVKDAKKLAIKNQTTFLNNQQRTTACPEPVSTGFDWLNLRAQPPQPKGTTNKKPPAHDATEGFCFINER
jgi:hypothetical protein